MQQGGKTTRAVVLGLVLVLSLATVGLFVWRDRWGRHHRREADRALQRRDFQTALFHLRRCLAVWPGDRPTRLMAARTARRLGDLDEAMKHLRPLTREVEPDEECRVELDLIEVQQGDRVKAVRLLNGCLKQPERPDTDLILESVIDQQINWLNMANDAGMTMLEGPAGQARAETERAIALWEARRTGDADRAQALVWRGRIHLLIDQRRAVAEFREALELAPGHTATRFQLAVSLVEFDPREAATHLERVRQEAPGDVRVAILLGILRRRLGQYEEAVGVFDAVLESDPEHLSALLERGKTSLDAGRPQEAIAFLRRALSLAPKEASVHLVLSRALHLSGDEAEAKRHQHLYAKLEADRTRTEAARAEQEREAWRRRVEREAKEQLPPGDQI